MEYFYRQSQWVGIGFAELSVQLDKDAVAAGPFFSAFYTELRHRYPTYQDLPGDYVALKEATAEAVAEFVGASDRVYSFGAGIGYVEHVLAERHGFSSLTIWDPSASAALYHLDNRIELARLDPLEGLSHQTFDCVLAVQVTYALSGLELRSFLNAVRRLLEPGGQLVLVNYSPRFRENERRDGGNESTLRTAIAASRDFAHSAVRRATKGLRRTGPGAQGWGWARDNASLRNYVTSEGFSEPRFFGRAGQSILVCRTPQL